MLNNERQSVMKK